MMLPVSHEARPQENCWTDELTLMNPPRKRDSTVAVIIAMAGTNRPDMQIISSVEVPSAANSGTRGRWVSKVTGMVAESDITVNTYSFPARSAHRPTMFMLKKVHAPPAK